MIELFAALFFIFIFASAILFWPKRHHKSSLFIALYFFVMCFGLYAWVGSPRIVPLLAQRETKLAEIKQSIVQNSAQVKSDRKNLKAWVALGQAFIETGQFSAAANSFKQAVVLSNGDPELILAYAKSMILADDGKVSDHSQKSLEMVLLQEPQNPEARYWLIVRKLQDGDNEQAMKEMKTLYRELPEDSPLKATINAQIGRN